MRTPVLYLGSYFVSVLGNSIAAIALPLIVLQLTGSAISAGWVAAATAVPAVLAGLFMGVVIDRINRVTSSVLTDLVSAASIAALPIVDALAGLEVAWFVLFGIIGSLGDVPGMTAREALLPGIARDSSLSLERLVGVRESLGSISLLIGPAVAGLLMTLFEGSTVLWITAGTSLLAALLTLAIPRRVGRTEDVPATEPLGAWAEFVEGWRLLTRTRVVAMVTGLMLFSVMVLSAFQALILPVHFTRIDRPGLLGFVLTSIAAGLLVGSAVYVVLAHRFTRRTWLATGLLVSSLGFTVVGLLPPTLLLFAAGFVLGLGSGLCGALLGLLTVSGVPETALGRVMGAQNALVTAAAPAAILLAAVVIEHVSLTAAALGFVALWGVTSVVAVVGPALRDLGPIEPETIDA
ncbi:MFS transporter [Aeromicrobium senzhongii]|uniref:Multidrug efflux pump Tap n=1 Tax=Aeromicrobium senzhongii TaxID=2663859 RepID=A0ABX6SQK0_9ACTN|nr:MFS transporter [Aeromicrobium senzhongii]MTB89068.1 MFS transporter [Aeromicrobium senzhongii]QNL93661.1 MFS transporter [Aeromicrobium senzhongii]